MRQGPWTDLYSLGATLHYVLAGQPPTPSVVRAVADVLPPLASLPRPQTLSQPRAIAGDDRLDARARPGGAAARRRIGAACPARRAGAAGLAHTGDGPRRASRAVGRPACEPGREGERAGRARALAASQREEAAATSDTAAAFASDDGSERARRDTPRRDARATVTLMALLGLAVLLGGAWTLDGAGLDLAGARIAAPALGASSRAHVSATPLFAAAGCGDVAPGAVARSGAANGGRVANGDAAIAVAGIARCGGDRCAAGNPGRIDDGSDRDRLSGRRTASAGAAGHYIGARQRRRLTHRRRRGRRGQRVAQRSAASAHAAERRGARSRAVHPVGRGQVQSVTARARFAPAGAGCDASGVLAQFMCAIRQCSSARSSAAPECARDRRIEEARARRVERLRGAPRPPPALRERVLLAAIVRRSGRTRAAPVGARSRRPACGEVVLARGVREVLVAENGLDVQQVAAAEQGLEPVDVGGREAQVGDVADPAAPAPCRAPAT